MGNNILLRGIALSFAMAPALIMLSYFLVAARIRLNWERVWGSFGLGACSAPLASGLSELIKLHLEVGQELYIASAYNAFLLVAFSEEIVKLLALLCVIGKQLHRMSPREIFALAIACSCGFACLENFFYVLERGEWLMIALLRAIAPVPGHAFMGAVMGFCIVQATRSSYAVFWWVRALFYPFVMHGTYNFFLFALQHLMERTDGNISGPAAQLMIGFIIVVIVEGVIAHLALRDIAAMPDEKSNEWPLMSLSHQVQRLLGMVDHPAFWGGLGILYLSGAGCLLLISPRAGGVEAVAYQGFAAFSFLHGLAFVILSKLVYNRTKWLKMGKLKCQAGE